MKRIHHILALIMVLSLIICSPTLSADRKVLAEMFTSTTCPPCYPADLFYFHSWLPSYWNAENVITIAYHVWWPAPGNDPMYLANPTPVQNRVSYYQGASAYAPRMYIDGFIDGGATYADWPNLIESRFSDPSPLTITLSGTRSGNTLNLTGSIYAEAPVNSSNWRVHWVVVEDSISAPQAIGGGQYVPFIHNWAHRGMYPDANGSAISISQGQTVQVQRSITISGNWVPDNCKVIVFVQNNTDKKVQQAEVIPVRSITVSVNEPTELPRSFSLNQNYPNPFNPTTRLSFVIAHVSFVTLKVYNLLGQEVATLVTDVMQPGTHEVEWDGKAQDGSVLPSGVYTYRLTAGEFRQTRKMILLR